MVPSKGVPVTYESCSGSHKVVREARKQLFDERLASQEQRMGVPTLRHAAAWLGRAGHHVTFDHCDLVEMLRQHPRGEKSCDAAADDHRVVA
jgi:hypothetical protein